MTTQTLKPLASTIALDKALTVKAKTLTATIGKTLAWETEQVKAMPSMVLNILTIASDPAAQYLGHYDKAAAIGHALKESPKLFKAWELAIAGRIPHALTVDKTGRVILGKKNPALLLTDTQIKARDDAAELAKSQKAEKTALTRQNTVKKAEQADMLKAELHESKAAALKVEQERNQAVTALVKAKATVKKAESLEKAAEQAKVQAEQAEQAVKTINIKVDSLESENQRLRALESDLMAERALNGLLEEQNKDLKADLHDAQELIAELKARLNATMPVSQAA